jgi:hypothetical protein
MDTTLNKRVMTKFNYAFDEKNGILFKKYFGNISVDDIKASWLYAFENHVIPPNTKGFLLDYREASFALSPDENKEISGFYKQHIQFFRDCKVAIVTEKPKDIVIPILVKQNDDGYKSEPFYTIKSAVEWILKG